MFKVIAYRNGVDVATLAPGKGGFKPFKTRAAADRYARQLNAYAAAHAPLLRASGTTVEYRVEERDV